MLETVKHGVVLLQMAKSQITSSQSSGRTIRASSTDPPSTARSETDSATSQAAARSDDRNVVDSASSEEEEISDNRHSNRNIIVPPTSYSSSDEDEFYEAQENSNDHDASPFNEQPKHLHQHLNQKPKEESEPAQRRPSTSESAGSRTHRALTDAGETPQPNYDDDNEDFDAVCDDTAETDVGNLQEEHGSVLMHLLSQVSIGMDLTKVTLPTFILERRSLLEMYADFFAHPDD
uniref:Uncharacterized protein n=1 Tax=Plectus sambesii TaxID=2011161 RepID=A0A914VFD3_9BILA